MKKIVVLAGFQLAEKALTLMREVAEVVVIRDLIEDAPLAAVRDADAILAGASLYLNRRLIESAKNLRHIARVGVGVDRIDLKAASEFGVIVTNTPEVSADPVAEFTMALLLSLAKNIPVYDGVVRNGQWNEKSRLGLVNRELNGKIHGVVGLGRIGRRVAVRCKAFGMHVLYYKRTRDMESEETLGVKYAPFEVLVKEADSISLHLPLTDETTNLFDKAQFESMKNTALLINQARGKVVNEDALARALNEGKIGGYATDVYAHEPPDPKSELLKLKNTVFTPHSGGSSPESHLRLSMAAAEEVLRVMRGDQPKNLINKEVLPRKSING
jgi:D-3-phosphoglycerate dehydrogenase